jgi:hypothetical protein
LALGIAPLKKGTNLISDSKGKAELLLNQFKSVFTKPTNNDLPSTRIQSKNNIRPIIIDQKGLEIAAVSFIACFALSS